MGARITTSFVLATRVTKPRASRLPVHSPACGQQLLICALASTLCGRYVIVAAGQPNPVNQPLSIPRAPQPLCPHRTANQHTMATTASTPRRISITSPWLGVVLAGTAAATYPSFGRCASRGGRFYTASRSSWGGSGWARAEPTASRAPWRRASRWGEPPPADLCDLFPREAPLLKVTVVSSAMLRGGMEVTRSRSTPLGSGRSLARSLSVSISLLPLLPL